MQAGESPLDVWPEEFKSTAHSLSAEVKVGLTIRLQLGLIGIFCYMSSTT